MIVMSLLALAAALHPTNPSFDWPEPPEEMVDFLGRRQLCGYVQQGPEQSVGDRIAWARLNCASLPQEESEWRARYASNEDVRRWLDQDPNDFQMPTVYVSGYHGPPPADARHLLLSGQSYDTGSTFRLSVDHEAQRGRYTTFTASFAGLAPRTFAVDNERFPGVDLQSIAVSLGRSGPGEVLIVELRSGYERGYCSINEQDDRPRLTIYFRRSEIQAWYQDRTNCRTDSRDLPNALQGAP
jgi:hypothetical protein